MKNIGTLSSRRVCKSSRLQEPRTATVVLVLNIFVAMVAQITSSGSAVVVERR